IRLFHAFWCHICRKERKGDVLVFMTGWDDIISLKDQLKAHPHLRDPNTAACMPWLNGHI
ncbi:DEA(D/H)-box RNA helicase family protein, partial [Thalictrum thalictroides]